MDLNGNNNNNINYVGLEYHQKRLSAPVRLVFDGDFNCLCVR